jgi:hypothetical protein
MPSFQPAKRMPAPPTRPERRLRTEPDGDRQEHAGPGGPEGPEELQERPNRKWTAALGGLVIVLGALGAYDLLSGGGSVTAAQAPPRPASHTASPAASRTHTAHARPSRTPAATPASRPSATGSAAPSARPSPVAKELSAVSATAFGPSGTSDGDNPSLAPRVLAGDGVNAWASSWYRTPDFGRLQAGTGLLLDMGSEVSVSRVRVVLGAPVGADLSLRLGDTADPVGLSTATSASDVGGTVRLSLSSPKRARYLLVWFTRLPPDDAGTYQVLVYSIKVSGHA